MHERSDSGMNLEKGQKIEIPYRLLEFPCESMQEFYRVFFENRKCMGMDDSLPKILPFNEQFQIQKDKDYYLNMMQSYNIPEFISSRVDIKPRSFVNVAKEPGIPITFKK